MSYDLGATVARLKAAGVDNPRLDARVLWAYAQNVAGQTGAASADASALFESYLVRRIAREPVAYITGNKEFWGLDFAVGPGVLVPRPDTETVVEAVLAAFGDRQAPLNVIDLGTGSGCILAAVLREYPKATGLAVEASSAARSFARRNFDSLGLTGRTDVFAGNWLDAPRGDYDVVLSNPPYIRSAEIVTLEPEVTEYEPVSALDGGADGLCAYRVLAERLGGWLSLRGQAFFEIGQGQEGDVADICTGAGLHFLQAKEDLSGTPRVVIVARA